MAHGQSEKSAFEQSLERDTGVRSTESWVDIKGVRYRKIEFKSEHYYLVPRKKDAKTADVYCEPPKGWQSEHLVIEEPKVVARSAAFVQAFHESCEGVKDGKKRDLRLTSAMGLSFKNEPSGGD